MSDSHAFRKNGGFLNEVMADRYSIIIKKILTVFVIILIQLLTWQQE